MRLGVRMKQVGWGVNRGAVGLGFKCRLGFAADGEKRGCQAAYIQVRGYVWCSLVGVGGLVRCGAAGVRVRDT